jgi:leucyl-tRNA synthetase
MDQYIGGIEHAILHLLYARFWTKVMRDLKLLQVDEPFTKLLTQGMVLNHIYSKKTPQGGVEYFWPQDVENIADDSGRVTSAKLIKDFGDYTAGTVVSYDGVGTMSKSKNNGVDPQALIERYGADTARLYTMFTAPPEATLEWNDTAVEGSFRFLRRLWQFAFEHRALFGQEALSTALHPERLTALALSPKAKTLRREIYQVLKQANFDYERMQYNTVVSAVMKMLNVLEAQDPLSWPEQERVIFCEAMGILLRVVNPVCPHISEALWRDLGFLTDHGPMLDVKWPDVHEAALVQDELELVLQVNGKLRGALKVSVNASEQEIKEMALAHEATQRLLLAASLQAPKKVIVVPKRLVNVVI